MTGRPVGYHWGAAGEQAGRPHRTVCSVRKVRAPQGRVVGNTDPG